METPFENTIEILDGEYGEKKYGEAYSERRKTHRKKPVGGAFNIITNNGPKRRTIEVVPQGELCVDELAGKLQNAFINRLSEESKNQIQWVIDSYTKEDVEIDPHFNILKDENRIEGSASQNTLVVKISSNEITWVLNRVEDLTEFVQKFLKVRKIEHKILNENANIIDETTYVLYIAIPEAKVSSTYMTDIDDGSEEA